MVAITHQYKITVNNTAVIKLRITLMNHSTISQNTLQKICQVSLCILLAIRRAGGI